MALRVRLTTVDDVDGQPATQRVRFALDGQVYEIDLSGQNAAALRASAQPFIEAARRLSLSHECRSRPVVDPDEVQTRAIIRDWAYGQGIASLPAPGRASRDLTKRYAAAHTAPASWADHGR